MRERRDQLEQELKRLLRRKEPSPGFTDRTMARARRGARSEAASEQSDSSRIPRWKRFAIAAGLCAVLSSAGLYYERQVQQAKAEEAGRQVMLALRITAATLAEARAKVLKSGAMAPGE